MIFLKSATILVAALLALLALVVIPVDGRYGSSGPVDYQPTNTKPKSEEKSEKKQMKPYEFGYEIQDKDGNLQHRHEQSDENGVRRGSYGYVDANGVYRKVEYIADKNGFRVKEMKSNEPGFSNKSSPANVKMGNNLAEPSSAENSFESSYKRPSKIKRNDEASSHKLLGEKSHSDDIGSAKESSKPKAIVVSPSPGFIDNPNYQANYTLTKRGSASSGSTGNEGPREYDSYLASTPHYYYGSGLRKMSSPSLLGSSSSTSTSSPYSSKFGDHSVPTYQDTGKGGHRGSYLSAQSAPYRSPAVPPYQSPYPVPGHGYSLPPGRHPNEIGHSPRIPPYQSFEPSRLSPGHSGKSYLPSGYMHPLQPVRQSGSHLPSPMISYALSTPLSLYPGSQPTSTPHPFLSNDIYDGPRSNYYEPSMKSPYYSPYGPPVTPVLPHMYKKPEHSPFLVKPSYQMPYTYTTPLYGPNSGSYGKKKPSLVPKVFYADEDNEVDKYTSGTSPYALRSGGANSAYGPYGARNLANANTPPDFGPNNKPNYYWLKPSTTTTTTTTETPAVLLGIRNAILSQEKDARAEKSRYDKTKTSESQIDHDSVAYMPAHYPSHDQIMLLRTGMRKLIPQASDSHEVKGYKSRLSKFHSKSKARERTRAEDESDKDENKNKKYATKSVLPKKWSYQSPNRSSYSDLEILASKPSHAHSTNSTQSSVSSSTSIPVYKD